MRLAIPAGLCMGAAFTLLTQFDWERSFYPTVLVVIVTYYLVYLPIGTSPTPERLNDRRVGIERFRYRCVRACERINALH